MVVRQRYSCTPLTSFAPHTVTILDASPGDRPINVVSGTCDDLKAFAMGETTALKTTLEKCLVETLPHTKHQVRGDHAGPSSRCPLGTVLGFWLSLRYSGWLGA